MDSRARRRVAWALFGISLAVRVFFLVISDNQDGDAFGRILLARRLVDQKLWNPTEVWLPLHFWILAGPYALGLKAQIWPRLLTALAGAGAIPFAYLIAEGLFGSAAALATGMILALNPLHIRFSVVTVSEGFLILFVTQGLWAFLQYVRGGSRRHLAFGALALNLASGQRMEAWLLVPFLATGAAFDRFLLGRHLTRGARRRVVVFSIAAGAFALGWSIFSWMTYGDPVHIATLNAQRVAADPVFQKTGTGYKLAFWPGVLVASLGPLAFVAGIVATVRSCLWGPRRIHGLMFFAFLAAYYVQNLRSGMITDARYGLLLVWLLVLNLGAILGERSERDWPMILTASSVIWLLAVWGLAETRFGVVSAKLQSISPRPRVEAGIREVDDWMRTQKPVSSIVLGPGLVHYSPWMSRLDDWYGVDRVKVMEQSDSVVDYVRREPSGYFVLASKSTLAQALGRGSVEGAVTLGLSTLEGEYVVYRWPAVGRSGTPLQKLIKPE